MAENTFDRLYMDPEILGPEPERETRVRSRFWTTFRRAARVIPFGSDVVAAYYCALDPQTPAKVRALLLGALVYFVSPFDVVPDMLLGLGFTDDITVLATTIGVIAAHIRPAHRQAAAQALAGED